MHWSSTDDGTASVAVRTQIGKRSAIGASCIFNVGQKLAIVSDEEPVRRDQLSNQWDLQFHKVNEKSN